MNHNRKPTYASISALGGNWRIVYHPVKSKFGGTTAGSLNGLGGIRELTTALDGWVGIPIIDFSAPDCNLAEVNHYPLADMPDNGGSCLAYLAHCKNAGAAIMLSR